MPPERLFLVDGSSLVYRSYYALLRGGKGGAAGRGAGLATSRGLPTGAVYGFFTVLRKILSDHRPRYMGIAFDHRVPTVRHEAYAEYKANRKPMPEDLALQLPFVHRAIAGLRIPVLVEPRWEADDVLGTLARKGAEAGLDVVVVTGDKDMYQLLGERVSMLQVRLETKLVGAADVPAEFGVPPERVPDVLALMGDASDNIPGVRGIGEKGAKALIGEWGGLDALYRNLERLKPAQAQKLREGEKEARLSLELATIRTDLAVELDLAALELALPDRAALHALATELEFRALAEEFAPEPEPSSRSYRCLGDEEALAALLARARAGGRLAVAPAGDARGLVGVGLAASAQDAAYLPLAHGYADCPPQVAEERALALLRPLLEDEGVAKLAPDVKELHLRLARRGIELRGELHDLLLLSYLLDPGGTAHDLDSVAARRVLRRTRPLASLTGKGRAQISLPEVAVEAMAGHAGERAELLLLLVPLLLEDVERQGLGRLYREVELPLARVLAGMERAGVRVDAARLREMGGELDRRLGELTRRVHELAGTEFNLSSPRQLGEVLFERMGLPVVKKTRLQKAASTDTEVLEELARDHELPRLVLEHRELTKLKGTYVDALPALVDPADGRVHTSYHQAVAATGRLSSSDPNLQNIPVRTELGRSIRGAFVAEPGWSIVAADYSQIELRLLAHLSRDEELVRAFAEGADVHTRTAATMFGVAEALVTPELRRRAKVINFGIVYGMSAFGLSRELGVPPAEARRLIDGYFARYAGVRAWLDRTVEQARAAGQVATLHGRIRRIPEIAAANRSVREYAERTAVNTPIQGTAADLIKLAMVRIARRLEGERRRARLLLQVHDELVLEAPAGEVAAAAALVREEMEGVERLAVPLVVTVGHGPSWLEAK